MEQTNMKTFSSRAERRPVTLRGYALGLARDSDILVADLSYDGCKIGSADAFKPGEIVELRIVSHGKIEAEIRWVAGGQAGARFVS